VSLAIDALNATPGAPVRRVEQSVPASNAAAEFQPADRDRGVCTGVARTRGVLNVSLPNPLEHVRLRSNDQTTVPDSGAVLIGAHAPAGPLPGRGVKPKMTDRRLCVVLGPTDGVPVLAEFKGITVSQVHPWTSVDITGTPPVVVEHGPADIGGSQGYSDSRVHTSLAYLRKRQGGASHRVGLRPGCTTRMTSEHSARSPTERHPRHADHHLKGELPREAHFTDSARRPRNRTNPTGRDPTASTLRPRPANSDDAELSSLSNARARDGCEFTAVEETRWT
jgi:hypothetical protein